MIEVKNVSLKDYSSFRTGGMGELVVVKDEDELIEAIQLVTTSHRALHILGESTNTIFGENLEPYLFVNINILGISVQDDSEVVLLTAYAGENWDDVVSYAVSSGLSGIENLSYIPGTAGASPVQNIGAYGVELKDTLKEVRVYDIKTGTFLSLSNSDCAFGYRDSIFKHEKGRYIIISITLQLQKTFTPVLTYKPLDVLTAKQGLTLRDVRDEVIRIRTEKLPNYHEYPNCGSFFKNQIISKNKGEELRAQFPHIPLHTQNDGYKVPTAWLIEHVAEMKGVRVGDVGTWPTQPLVLVNYGNATLEDIDTFAHTIIGKVREKTGITLEREVNFIG